MMMCCYAKEAQVPLPSIAKNVQLG